jgi:hypothetical protein
MISELLGTWWIKPLAIGLAIIGLYGTGYYKGYQHEKVTFDNYKVTVASLATVVEEHNKIVMQEQKQITSNVVTSYADSVKRINDYYAKNPTIKFKSLLVHDSSSCSTLSSKGEGSTGTVATTNGANEATPNGDPKEVQVDMQKLSKEIVQFLELIKLEKEQDSIK